MKIQYIKGDVTKPVGKDIKIIIHICNNVNKYGAGVALAIKNKWPKAANIYHEVSPQMLGLVTMIEVEKTIHVANMIAQNGVRSKKNLHPIDYEALDICLEGVYESIKDLKREYKKKISIHAPKIGTGLAGGDWNKIEPLLIKWFTNNRIGVFIYEL